MSDMGSQYENLLSIGMIKCRFAVSRVMNDDGISVVAPGVTPTGGHHFPTGGLR